MQISTRKICSDSKRDGYLTEEEGRKKKKKALSGENCTNLFKDSRGLQEALEHAPGERRFNKAG